MDVKAFRVESDEWMASLGYGIHFHSADGTSLHYNINDVEQLEYAPGIECKIDSAGNKSCSLVGTNLKLFIMMKAENLQYKHPEIKKWIYAMTHYAQVCDHFPPNLSNPEKWS